MDFVNDSKNPQAFHDVPQNDRTMAMLIWILNIVTGFIGPLIIWLIKKDESPYVNQQGKNYFNFAISYAIYSIGASILTIILIGYIAIFLIWVACIVYTIIGIVATNKGEDFVVPLSIPIIK
ncbi:DUF4870 domain-containing protein [Staphylococcus condimenti]|uniref:DUF4870 domain-containing protein n=1 Tax=Staphylococcus condimenti TaxID=70255 RepID=A0A4Q7CJJ7_9STAP|nr:DUF4870 domain-containing protein [Staphylococcus condimenti]RZI00147.1 DUF4870 domain-containing protein [Staphylococcus condimenti]RZI00448.1 DUF4870 domain-containing protein [Staphylococcus condimenti]